MATNIDGTKVYIKWRKITKTTCSQTTQNTRTQDHLGNLSSLKIAHTNINSIRNKVDHISSELSDYDIICISETKLNDSVPTEKILIDGYKQPIRKDRPINSGGGLAVYTNNSISFSRREDIENNNIENLWIEVYSLRTKFLLGLFYRPPNSAAEFWDYFEDVLDKASEQNLDLLILGDFNYDILKHNKNGRLERIMLKFNLQHVINDATRITEHSETCIDLIMSNHISLVNNSEIQAHVFGLTTV